jgi:ABC-2 type transport system ATP-binding protein
VRHDGRVAAVSANDVRPERLEPVIRHDRAADPLIDIRNVRHSFGRKEALRGVSLAVEPGQIHALLGPNGAGKTTLLRVLSGLVEPRGGSASVAGIASAGHPAELRQLIGLVPSGDRTFYLRMSGLENLAFFAQMYGLSRREAVRRSRARLDDVGLAQVAKRPVNSYSHGMQKRLSVARALLNDPKALLVDEATHDLDPEGSQRVRRLVQEAAASGAAVIWATQRLEEIRGFADQVTLLAMGRVRFSGTVAELMSRAQSRAYLLGLGESVANDEVHLSMLRSAVWKHARLDVAPGARRDHLRLQLLGGATLGDAIAALVGAGVTVISCREEQSEVEQAFMSITAPEDEP